MSTVSYRFFIMFASILIFYPMISFGQKANTFSIDGNRLMISKGEIRKNSPEYIQALRSLTNDADHALNRGPYSVTFKKGVPSHISLNDYYSLSRYWWPDPSKPDGLPYIRRDGKVNPERDRYPDYSMMNNMAQDVFTLGLAYYMTEDEKYAKHAVKLIRVFFLDKKTKMNPHFRFSQVAFGHPNSGSATISATSLMSFIEGVQLLSHSRSLTSRDLKKLKVWFSDFLTWMLNDDIAKKQRDSDSNIGTYYTAQTAVYALFVGNNTLATEIIKSQGYKRIDKQIAADGAMPTELARATPWAYVKYNISALDRLVEVAKKVDVDLVSYTSPTGGSLRKLYDWILQYYEGNKNWSFSDEKVTRSAVGRVIARTRFFREFRNDFNASSESYRDLLF